MADNQSDRNGREAEGSASAMRGSAACVLATLGFACLTVWGTYIVFSPALPLLSFEVVEVGVACLIVSRVTANAALLFCLRKPDAVFDRLKRLVLPGSLALLAPAFALSALCWSGAVGGDAVLPVLVAAWVLLGAAELALSLSWAVLFSMMPAKWTALSIACGGALATPLFLLVAGAGEPLVGLLGIAFCLVACDLLAYFLLRKTGEEELAAMKGFHREPAITLKAALSVATNGLVYGYVVVMLALMGLPSVLVAAAAGVVGAGVAILWAVKRTRSRWDVGTMQRATVPIVAASILFIPFCDEVGRTACGAVAIGTFAYATLMEWTDLVVSNAEFQLYPVRRYAKGRFAQWTGFTAGALVAYFAFHAFPLPSTPLALLSCIIAVVVVAAFALYGADDSDTKEALLAVMTAGADSPPIIDPPKNAAPFRERCDAVMRQYDLSQREMEVFLCLAKGRNAEYIQQKLFISGNTAKTHIAHIYRKMGINSQQRLIDMVDREAEATRKCDGAYGSMPIDSNTK